MFQDVVESETELRELYRMPSPVTASKVLNQIWLPIRAGRAAR